jgi:hypothetical protein
MGRIALLRGAKVGPWNTLLEEHRNEIHLYLYNTVYGRESGGRGSHFYKGTGMRYIYTYCSATASVSYPAFIEEPPQ